MLHEALAFYHSLHGADRYWSIDAHALADDALLTACEKALGHRLPGTFRSFAKSSPFFEYRFLSLRDDQTARPALVGLNRLLHQSRPHEHVLPPELCVFMPSWDGHCYCFDFSKQTAEDEWAISYLWLPDHVSIALEPPEIVGHTFDEFCWKRFSAEWKSVFASIKKKSHQKRKTEPNQALQPTAPSRRG